MSLLNVESYIFINVFYLVLFCIHVCVDDVIYIYKWTGSVKSSAQVDAAGQHWNFCW